ncbi:hypothetical protein PAXRUDRAFT_18903 [Paxillus rubicundulus Ve08.2h10]|uniref:Uncharacterized protein n=1 Tax=Paxillus rubicundulus Ve08.2h10 TaxID=930991 RepID=A0A0D0CWS6_9AGAM|nr:hypothetical protein PAXRUDRAFT_18903 [Paxillus rubicundulus Ve08.2h10]
MAGDLIAMPLCGSRDSPKFDGRTLAHLLCFFEDIEILGEAAHISEEAQIKVAIRYTDLDEVEVWLTLMAASSRNWDTFVAAVKDFTITRSQCTVKMTWESTATVPKDLCTTYC